MAVLYFKDDLFSSRDLVIAHGCNTLGVMGAGVAYQVKIRYPKAFKEYRISKRTLGNNIIVDCGNRIIVNMITQSTIGRSGQYVDYAAIQSCFENLFKWMAENNHSSVSIPKIGAGLGGGDWDVIAEIIELLSADYQMTVNVWTI